MSSSAMRRLHPTRREVVSMHCGAAWDDRDSSGASSVPTWMVSQHAPTDSVLGQGMPMQRAARETSIPDWAYSSACSWSTARSFARSILLPAMHSTMSGPTILRSSCTHILTCTTTARVSGHSCFHARKPSLPRPGAGCRHLGEAVPVRGVVHKQCPICIAVVDGPKGMKPFLSSADAHATSQAPCVCQCACGDRGGLQPDASPAAGTPTGEAATGKAMRASPSMRAQTPGCVRQWHIGGLLVRPAQQCPKSQG
jgi:hypothetical protein